MKVSVWAILTGLAACASAAPAPVPHVVHEKRSTQMQKWSRRDVKLSRDTIIPISIGLAQSNLDKGYEFLMDVSHPGSDNFGKHWSMEKIKHTFAPSKDTVVAVKTWLIESGIESERIQLSKSLTWVKLNATIEEAESLLKTEYSVYTHVDTGDDFLAVEEYSLPEHIREHVDFVTPTVHFDLAVKMKGKRTDLAGRDLDASHKIKSPVPQIHPDPLRVPLSSVKFNLTNCNRYITPECLQTLYELPNGTAGPGTYAVVEYTPQAYVQTDLDLFYSTLKLPIPAGTGPAPIDLIDGGVVQDIVMSFNYNGESNLDLSYAIGLLYPQQVGLYQVGDLVEGASFNNFLDALDASYCSYEGGDDSFYDAIYPDPFGGYQSQDCGTVAPAQVISTSYGYNEADLSAAYEQRQCNEYMKLGLAGVSVLYSSGDYGVAGNGGQCCVNPGCAGGLLNGGDEGTFNPSFPGTCPYVTSVGATQVKHNYAVTPTVPSPEGACETVIYSGGGFSNVFPMPDYQANAIGFYYQHHTPDKYNATVYNDSQKARGFPDVSANGANYVIAVDGSLGLVYGTSASSPVFGAIVTMINNERIAVGKGPVGFLNPTLYAFPAALNDITLGWNQGCGTQGFRAVKGWDPLTGLGTPNYPKLLEVFLALP